MVEPLCVLVVLQCIPSKYVCLTMHTNLSVHLKPTWLVYSTLQVHFFGWMRVSMAVSLAVSLADSMVVKLDMATVLLVSIGKPDMVNTDGRRRLAALLVAAIWHNSSWVRSHSSSHLLN